LARLAEFGRAELRAFVAGYLYALAGGRDLDKDLAALDQHDLAREVRARLKGSEGAQVALRAWDEAIGDG